MIAPEDVENTLIAIGDAYRSEVQYAFITMITMIINQTMPGLENEHMPCVLACANMSAYEALRAIWVETSYLGRPGEMVTLRSMLEKIDKLGKSKIAGDRTKEIAASVALLMNTPAEGEKMHLQLVIGRQVLRDKKTIKTGFVQRYEGLQHLGLVEIHRKERGPKRALHIRGVSLTKRGDAFLLDLMRHSILLSMDQHPDAGEWQSAKEH